jgi:hypothetical protein
MAMHASMVAPASNNNSKTIYEYIIHDYKITHSGNRIEQQLTYYTCQSGEFAFT